MTMEVDVHNKPLRVGYPPATPGPAAQRVVTHICELFESGRLRPGDRLPSERELAQTIGVSRPSLRAGLQSLAAAGLVASRRGSGTYVSSGPPPLGGVSLPLMAAWHGVSWNDLFEARAVLELEIVARAAERATPAQIAQIGKAVRDLMAAATRDRLDFLRCDMRFHQTVAAATGNPVLSSLVEMVRGLFAESRQEAVLQGRDLSDVARLHQEIYNALSTHDAQRAREAMAAHLEYAQREYALEQQLVSGGESLEDL